MTIQLPNDLQAQLEAIGRETGRDPQALAVEVLTSFAEDQAAYIASVKRGAAQLERGETIPHEQVMGEMRELIGSYRRKQ